MWLFYFIEYGVSFVMIVCSCFMCGWFVFSSWLLLVVVWMICVYLFVVSCLSSGDGISVWNVIVLL